AMSDQDEAEPSAAPYVPTTTAQDTGEPAPDQPRGRQPLTGNAIIQAVTEGHSGVLTILAGFVALLVGAWLIAASGPGLLGGCAPGTRLATHRAPRSRRPGRRWPRPTRRCSRARSSARGRSPPPSTAARSRRSSTRCRSPRSRRPR